MPFRSCGRGLPAIPETERKQLIIAGKVKGCSNHRVMLLTRTIDHLFDRRFISFEDNGQLSISPVAHSPR
jgi:hypothetical protein